MEVLRRALPLAALLLAGCEFTRDPVRVDLHSEELMVHGILAAGSDTVAVLLTRVRTTGADSAATVAPVSGATVRITGGGEAVRLDQAPAGFAACIQEPAAGPSLAGGCYTAVLRGGVRAGTTYALDVQVDGRAPVRGSATVPAGPVIHAPAPGARFGVRRRPGEGPTAVLPVRWHGTGEDGGFGVGVAVTAVYSQQTRVSDAVCTLPQGVGPLLPPTADSAVVALHHPALCQTPAGPLEPDSIQARVVVAAYDTGHAHYAALVQTYAGRPLWRERFAVGVTGALGVFAGIATAEVPVTLVPVD